MSKEKLLFLIKHSSIIESRVDEVIHLSSDSIFNEIFQSLDYYERVKINQRKIHESKQLAIKKKDHTYMRKIATFARNTYTVESEGYNSYNVHMLDFYKEIKDSLQYIRQATRYHRQYYMYLNIDSISKVELNKVVTRDGKQVRSSSFYRVGNTLNDMAWNVYLFTKDEQYLQNALEWSESTLINEHSPFTDTHAHLLYKLDRKDEAIIWQQKAIDQAFMVRNEKKQELQEELEKMKSGILE